MNPFERRSIGRTAVEVTRLGLGTGWPPGLPDEQGRSTARRAYERGLRYIDTAPFYANGASERQVGAALGSEERSSYALSTKVGRLIRPIEGAPAVDGASALHAVFDFSRDGVRQSLAESRERLGFDKIDIALIHDPDDHHAQARDDAFAALAERRASGEIGAIGFGMNASEPLAEFAAEVDLDCVLLAGRYTLFEQDALDTVVPALIERGASIIAGGVLNSGLLTTPRPGITYNYAPVSEAVLERAQRLEATCARFDVPLRAAAIQFPLALPIVATVVVGSRTPEEVDDAVAMFQLPIPGELWTALKEDDLIRADAPVPSDRSRHTSNAL